MSDKNSSGGGSLLLTLLAIAFIVLKLCGVINWSWWWVTAPLWGGLAIAVAFVAIWALVEILTQKPSRPKKSQWAQRLEAMQEQQRKLKEKSRSADEIVKEHQELREQRIQLEKNHEN